MLALCTFIAKRLAFVCEFMQVVKIPSINVLPSRFRVGPDVNRACQELMYGVNKLPKLFQTVRGVDFLRHSLLLLGGPTAYVALGIS